MDRNKKQTRSLKTELKTRSEGENMTIEGYL